MNTEKTSLKHAGVLLGALLGIHLLMTPLPGWATPALLVLVLVGVVCRSTQAFPPMWLAAFSLLGIPALVLLPDEAPAEGLAAGLGLWLAVFLLLRPMSPRRVLWILLCAILVIVALVLLGDVTPALIVVDVAVLVFVAQLAHTPEEATQSLGVLLLRAARLMVPVAAVVIPVFWLFSALSTRTQAATAGFSGELNPGDFSELRAGRQVAFVATFPEGTKVPTAAELFWRARVLDQNQGFRWTGSNAPVGLSRTLRPTEPWRYALLIEPARPYAPVGVVDSGWPMTTAPNEPLAIEVNSYPLPASDPPGEGLLSVPGPIAEDAEMRALADTIFAGKEGTPERLKALAVWFRNEGFTYTVRPGRMESLTKFLTRSRKGFCEHYAAASANLLRLAGVPARVITGYRGGRWNPWLRTLTIRDADAHAWVEAWDPNSGNWLRFDATTSVAPGLLLQIELDRDPTRWAWPRTVMVYIETVNTRFQNAIAEGGQFRTVAVIVAVALFLGGLAFFFFRRPKATPADEALAAMLVFGARHEIPRQPGETPLSWIERSKPAHPSASASLERFARAYEQAVYDQPTPEAHCELRAASSALRKT